MFVFSKELFVYPAVRRPNCGDVVGFCLYLSGLQGCKQLLWQSIHHVPTAYVYNSQE